uniref:Reverse transcriptase domain-containing protein n=1 Tax=Cannabis sativa TaxID=3483 RepID=A0A803P5V7_CANSA
MLNLYRKLKKTKDHLLRWNRKHFKMIHKQVEDAQQSLELIERENSPDVNVLDEARARLNEALAREEIFWRQKSRVAWLKEGDRCTKFFMASTVVRRRKNFIQAIKNENNEWIRDPTAIAGLFVDKFNNIFTGNRPSSSPDLHWIRGISVTQSENEFLNSIPSDEEIEASLRSMGNDKAPGPDGMPVGFYTQHWDTTKRDLIDMGYIKPRCGLRQGDPLSPALFILAADVLSRLLMAKAEEGAITGFKISRNGPAITRLMFVDDIILFGKATIKEARGFLKCLEDYCSWSGQAVNYNKSTVFFSKGVAPNTTSEISQLLGMKRMKRDAIYLGLPLFRSLKKTTDLQFLVDRVIPLTIARKVDKCLRDFWWGDTEERKTMHTIAWNSLCQSKLRGGLGFRCVETVNKAFILKWAWKALTDDSSIWSKVIKAKYLKDRNFLDVEQHCGDSGMWKAILKSRTLLNNSICRKIRNGADTSIWFDPWNDVKAILNIDLPQGDARDSWLWMGEPNGTFSIKSACRLVKGHTETTTSSPTWKTIWNSKVHHRLKFLWWQLARDSFPTRGKLSTFMNLPSNLCPLCDQQIETTMHLFWKCNLAKAIWFNTRWGIRTECVMVDNWNDWELWFLMDGNRPHDVSFDEFMTTTLYPEIGEALALCMAAELVNSLGYDQACFQCDNLTVTNVMQPRAAAASHFKLETAKDRFTNYYSNFRSWDLIHTPRACNFIAHNVAKWARLTNTVGSINPMTLETNILDDYVEWSHDNG